MQFLTVQSEPMGTMYCPVIQELKKSSTTVFWGWTIYSPLPTVCHKKTLMAIVGITHTQSTEYFSQALGKHWRWK